MKKNNPKQRKQQPKARGNSLVPGSNRGKRVTNADWVQKEDAYKRKVEEYGLLSIDQLIELEKDKSIRGTYRTALLNTLKKAQKAKEEIDNQIVNEEEVLKLAAEEADNHEHVIDTNPNG